MVLQLGKGKEEPDLLFLHFALITLQGGPWPVGSECSIPTRAGAGVGHGEMYFLPSEEERDVKSGAVQIDKLKKKHFQGKAVLPLGFCARLFCGQKGVGFERLASTLSYFLLPPPYPPSPQSQRVVRKHWRLWLADS